jgi:hypothetical protein
MATKPKFPYGRAEMFGRDIPLTKNGELNRVSLKKDEKEIYDEYLKELQKENKTLILKELSDFFKKKK